jgi:hypothetical protein
VEVSAFMAKLMPSRHCALQPIPQNDDHDGRNDGKKSRGRLDKGISCAPHETTEVTSRCLRQTAEWGQLGIRALPPMKSCASTAAQSLVLDGPQLERNYPSSSPNKRVLVRSWKMLPAVHRCRPQNDLNLQCKSTRSQWTRMSSG